MRIAFVGNFSQSHCSEVHWAATLEDLGHEIIRIQENGIDEFGLDKYLSRPDFDMFFFVRTWGETVKLRHLERLRELGIPSVSYHLDAYVGLARKYLHQGKPLDEILRTDPFWRCDFVFSPDGDPESAKVFERNGVHHYYMLPGVYKSECVLGSDPPASIPVLFVGGGDYPGSPNGYGHPEWPYRDELIYWLRNNYGDRFLKYGHPQETVRNDALNRLYQNTKVTIGDSVCLGFTHENYTSDRIFETTGRGGFLIYPRIKGIEECFIENEEIVYYDFGNFDQLKEKIDYYLEHDEEREAIRRAGHERTKRDHTYHNRLVAMLEIVSGAKVGTQEQIPANTSERDVMLDNLPMKINLGAGSEPTADWVNVDWIKGEGIQVEHNLLLFPWPFEDGCADEIKAIDVLEHMPNYTPDNQATALAFVEECCRILQPGGTLQIQVPHWGSPNMWIDPTHVRGFDPKSMDYFDPSTDFGKWYGYYTRGKFKVRTELSHMPDGSPSNVTFWMMKI